VHLQQGLTMDKFQDGPLVPAMQGQGWGQQVRIILHFYPFRQIILYEIITVISDSIEIT
jgi:hypothetical protein